MRVILAEKPSVAKDLARILGCNSRANGYYRSASTIVTYAIGHLVQLAEPDAMNAAWGKPWRREQLPMIPSEWLYVPNTATAEQFQIVRQLLTANDTTEIVNATDAGREGEAIFRRIYQLTGSTKPVLRLWTSSLTDEAITESLSRLKPSRQYDSLADAAQARAQIDWLIGMNYSRAYSTLNRQLCSIGRVQTPTLALLVQRHKAITTFVKTPFYEVHTQQAEFRARALNKANRYDFEQKPEAAAILANTQPGVIAVVQNVDRKPRRFPAPQLHNLGELQKEANARFGFTADTTLSLAQSLYETHKVLTYPRTSSRYLSSDMAPALPKLLSGLSVPDDCRPHFVTAQEQSRSGVPGKRYVDDTKLSDHHAIIPTSVQPRQLSPDEQKLYELVIRRFLAMFLPDKETEESRIDLNIGGHPFRATGSRLVTAGWSDVYPSQERNAANTEDTEKQEEAAAEPQDLPAVSTGERFPVTEAKLVTKERKPPPRFTDASLLSAMETAGRTIDDEALRETMRTKGLGTEATRAAIIERLLTLHYVERKAKYLEPTPKGIALIQQVLPKLQSPTLTGEMEAQLFAIEEGTRQGQDLVNELAAALAADLPVVYEAAPLPAPEVTAASDPNAPHCPVCKQGVLRKPTGQAFFGCSRYREGCKFSLPTVFAQKKLTDKQIERLARTGHTTLIKGFVSQKTQKAFDAALLCNEQTDWKLRFDFGQTK